MQWRIGSKILPKEENMNIIITQYQPQHHRSVVDIITSIQQEEFDLPIRYEDQPDLINIPKFFDLFLYSVVTR